MKIALQFAGPLPREVSQVWYENIRMHMDCPIVHCTDMETEAFDFAAEVQRIDEQNIPKAKYRHLAQLKGDVLMLDYDIIVQKDVSDVFLRPFDIALTVRKAKQDKNEMLHLGSPHNTGVIFSRNQKFWEFCHERYLNYPSDVGWMSGQNNITECAHIFRKEFKIIELPGFLYNYTPKNQTEDLSERYIVHYKGHRKHWMVPTQAAYNEGYRVAKLAEGPTPFTPDHPNFERIMKLRKELGYDN